MPSQGTPYGLSSHLKIHNLQNATKQKTQGEEEP
mgnify:CR=1 FL=1